MTEKLTPPEFVTLAPQQLSPEDQRRIESALDAAYERGFKPHEIKPFFRIATVRTTPEMEALERCATETLATFTHAYGRALDDAALVVLTHGSDIALVRQPNGTDELWVDAPADRQRVGEMMPGRCVYRQWTRFQDGVMTVEREWLDPEIAEAAGRAVQP